MSEAIQVDQAKQTLSTLQVKAPPMTAKRLGDVIELLNKLEEENAFLYTRWVEAEATAMSEAKRAAAGAPPVTGDVIQGLFDDMAAPAPKPAAPAPAPADPDNMDFDTVFAQILASRAQIDTGALPPPAVPAEEKPAVTTNTSKLPARSTGLKTANGMLNADALLQRMPQLMKPVLTALRENSEVKDKLRPYAETALRMVDSFELLHDMRRGLFALKPFSFQPKDLLKQARKELLPRAAAADHQVIILADDDLPQMHADGERAYTVLCDMLDNAIRYTPNGGTIRMSADTLGDQMLFTVTDSGIGMSESDLDQIGAPFWRAMHQPLVSKQPAAGLRMFIAKRVLLLMGGELFISGEPGEGSSFSFTLPRGK
jgi:hypothetical protein